MLEVLFQFACNFKNWNDFNLQFTFSVVEFGHLELAGRVTVNRRCIVAVQTNCVGATGKFVRCFPVVLVVVGFQCIAWNLEESKEKFKRL
jgi:hypothetical protein